MSIYVLVRGGFGNILFDYMIGYSLAKKHNMKLYFINSPKYNRPLMEHYSIFNDCIITIQKPHKINIIKEQGFTYNNIIINNPNENYLLDGYFQSHKYSNEYINEMKEILFNNTSEKLKMQQYFNQYNPNKKPIIMLHVRRGDYLNLQDTHPVQKEKYYETSLKVIEAKIGKNFKLYCFSDDIPYLKSWSLLKKYDNLIIENEDIIETFILMSLCNHFIIANSSYSLLSYYFREQKNSIICIPQNWFAKKGPQFNLDDLVAPSNNRFII